MYLNKATLIGNITRKPELKSLPSGIAVCTFSIATNRTWKDKNGAKQENTDYHNIVVFGKSAENVSRYMDKGSQILIEGRMQTRLWDGQDGKKNYRTEVIADQIQFGNNTKKASTENKEVRPEEGQEMEIDPSDIPF